MWLRPDELRFLSSRTKSWARFAEPKAGTENGSELLMQNDMWVVFANYWSVT